MQIKPLLLINAVVTVVRIFFFLTLCCEFVNGEAESHRVTLHMDDGDSQLIQLAHNSRECQLSNKTSSSPFGS